MPSGYVQPPISTVYGVTCDPPHEALTIFAPLSTAYSSAVIAYDSDAHAPTRNRVTNATPADGATSIAAFAAAARDADAAK